MRLTDNIPAIEDLTHSLAAFLGALGFDQVRRRRSRCAPRGRAPCSGRTAACNGCSGSGERPSLGLILYPHPSTPTPAPTPQAHVVGHSYGSLVASRFVQLHPKSVLSLTLLDPVRPFWGGCQARGLKPTVTRAGPSPDMWRRAV
jgi:hypothetical protein